MNEFESLFSMQLEQAIKQSSSTHWRQANKAYQAMNDAALDAKRANPTEWARQQNRIYLFQDSPINYKDHMINF